MSAEQITSVAPPQIDEALRLADQFLRSVLLADDGAAGFPEIGGGQEIRPWGGTADGLIALVQLSEPAGSPLISRIASWLYDHQDDSTGGWESRGVVLVDATAMVVVSLLRSGALRQAPVARALAFILEHSEDGGFRPSHGRPARVYTTCLATWALRLAKDDNVGAAGLARRIDEALDASRTWLVNARTGDGGWAVLPKTAPTSAAHTGFALYVLALVGEHDNDVTERATYWLRNQVDTMVESRIELHRVGPQEREIRTVHVAPAWTLVGLSAHAVSFLDSDVQRLSSRILNHQDRGSGAFLWSASPDDPALPYIWATARCVHALSLVHEQVSSGFTAVDLARRVLGSEVAIQTLTNEVGRQRRNLRLMIMAFGVSLSAAVAVLLETPLEWLAEVPGDLATFAEDLWRDQGWFAVAFSVIFIPLAAALTWLAARAGRAAFRAVRRFLRTDL